VKKKILIIENDRDIRQIVDFILTEEGFEAQSIPEPEDVLGILPFSPDVILLDEFINARPGHRLCKKIKQIDQLKDIPVIIFSTAYNIELIAKECEANDYVSKPFDVEYLLEKVVGVLNHRAITDPTVN
jgi:two-component system phosphate regulon response regulator PhoB